MLTMTITCTSSLFVTALLLFTLTTNSYYSIRIPVNTNTITPPPPPTTTTTGGGDSVAVVTITGCSSNHSRCHSSLSFVCRYRYRSSVIAASSILLF